MVRVFLWLLVSIAATWLVADTIKQKGPGYVLVYYNQYSLETSVWIAVLLLLALVFLFYLLIRFVHMLLRAGLLLGYQRRRYRQRQQQRSVHAVIEQDWQRAVQLAEKGQSVDDWLLATRAALSAGAIKEAEHCLKKAQFADSAAPEPVFSILRYDLLLARQRYDDADALLQQLLKANKGHIGILLRSVDLYCQRHRYAALQTLLPQLVGKMPAILEKQQQQLLEKTANCLFVDAEKRKSPEDLAAYWKKLSKSPARDSLLPLYCRKLISLGKHAEAEKLLQARLQKVFDDNCLVPYALLESVDRDRQLAFLQSLLPGHRDNARLHLAIGIVFIRQLQLDAAYKAIEYSIQLQPEPEAYQILAQYYDKRNDYRHARYSMQQALALAAVH